MPVLQPSQLVSHNTPDSGGKVHCVRNWSSPLNVLALVPGYASKTHAGQVLNGGYIWAADTPYTLDVDKMTSIDPS